MKSTNTPLPSQTDKLCSVSMRVCYLPADLISGPRFRREFCRAKRGRRRGSDPSQRGGWPGLPALSS